MHREALFQAITEIKQMGVLTVDKRKAFILESRLREILEEI